MLVRYKYVKEYNPNNEKLFSPLTQELKLLASQDLEAKLVALIQ